MPEQDPPLRMTTPDGRWTIEVSEDDLGQFCAVVILDGKTTTDSLFTEDSNKIIAWVSRQMREALRRTTPNVR